MSDFYVTLPSHSSKNEFPTNASNHFKIRLPHPIRLEGTGWKVALASISIPDSSVAVLIGDDPCSAENNTILFKCGWVRIRGGSAITYGRADFDCSDLGRMLSNVDGVGFMKTMISYFEQRRIYNNDGPVQGAKYVYNGKKTFIRFMWEGEELVINNNDVETTTRFRPRFSVNVELAKMMGWIQYRDDLRTYELGPNLRQEFQGSVIPQLSSASNDVLDDQGRPRFWIVSNGFMRLSITCNWRFLNINKAYESIVGASSRSLFVYSDVGGSSVVGNQVTDLLREVSLLRQGKGSQYFEPLHRQYIPARKDVIDIVETQVAETTGDLVKFGKGNTIVTLHFKKTAA